MQQTSNTSDRKAQLYLRTKPTKEARGLILHHRAHLAKLFERMRVKNRLAGRGDFHRTEIFLNSAEKWSNAFQKMGIEAKVNLSDLLALIEIPADERVVEPGIPIGCEKMAFKSQ